MLLQNVNLALRFLLELCALAALGYWGFRTGGSWVTKIVLGVGAPLLAAVVWGAFVSPKAAVRVPQPVWLGLQVLIFGAAAAALAVTGHRGLAWSFGVVVLINIALLYVWRQ